METKREAEMFITPHDIRAELEVSVIYAIRVERQMNVLDELRENRFAYV